MFTLIILSYLRRKTLQHVINAVKSQTKQPTNFLVWHNYPSCDSVAGVDNIFTDKNYGCFSRYVASLLYSNRYTIFMDDDIILKKKDVFEQLYNSLLSGEKMVGVCGRNIVNGARYYSRADDIQNVDEKVDVIKGWLCGISNELAKEFTNFILPEQIKNEDDISASAISQLILEKSPRLLPFVKTDFDYIRDKNGNMNRPDHKQRRDNACKYFLDICWKPQSWSSCV